MSIKTVKPLSTFVSKIFRGNEEYKTAQYVLWLMIACAKHTYVHLKQKFINSLQDKVLKVIFIYIVSRNIEQGSFSDRYSISCIAVDRGQAQNLFSRFDDLCLS